MRLNIALFFALFLSLGKLTASPETDYAHRLLDFTPVSATNPIVARIDGAVEIPLSEYHTYQRAEHLSTLKNQLDLAQKKEILNDLIDEYLLVDEACRSGADKHPGFTNRMEFTQTLILSDLLVTQEVASKAKTAGEYDKLLADLQNRLFDAATIDVSVQAYDKLKIAAKEINEVSETSSPSAKIRELIWELPDFVLARYNGIQITVKQILAIYAPLHAPRPQLETNQDLINILKPLIVPELLAAEARRRGMEALPAFQNKVIENQNALLRIYMHGVIAAQANRELHVPDLDGRIRSWYAQNAEHYSVESGDGVKTTPAYADIHKRVEGDYSVDLRDRIQAEKVRTLRQVHHIEIDDVILNGA